MLAPVLDESAPLVVAEFENTNEIATNDGVLLAVHIWTPPAITTMLKQIHAASSSSSMILRSFRFQSGSVSTI